MRRVASSRGGLLALLLAVHAGGTFAASRARYGGALRVTAVGRDAVARAPPLADTPLSASVTALGTSPLCRLEDGRLQPLLADLSRPRPGVLRVELLRGARGPEGQALGARALLRQWATLRDSPYRALFASFRGGARGLAGTLVSPLAVELPLLHPSLEVERALCHPALSPMPGLGPLPANPHFPAGRPYLDAVELVRLEERAARARAAWTQTDVALGPAPSPELPAPVPPGALRFATYLSFRPSQVGAAFRKALASAVDRTDLTRFFARAPAVPLKLPLPGLPPPPAEAAPKPPPPPRPPPTLTLLFDDGLAEHAAVAARLQVLMHDRGYRLALQPTSRAQLRQRWAEGAYELMLNTVLLPPDEVWAWAVVLELAGRGDLVPLELSALAAQPEGQARTSHLHQRIQALAGTLSLVPLFVQGVPLQVAPTVRALAFDAFGLPVWDAAFLAPETPADAP